MPRLLRSGSGEARGGTGGSARSFTSIHIGSHSSKGHPCRGYRCWAVWSPVACRRMGFTHRKAKHRLLLDRSHDVSGLVLNNAGTAGEGHDPAHEWTDSIPRAGAASRTHVSDLTGGCLPQSAAAAKRIAIPRRGN